MKMFKESSMVKRVLASFMAFLMVISLMPSMGHVFAAATEHPGYVTIMVVDGESNPIQGANVDYSIMKDPSVTDGDAFTTINSTGTTDEYGVVEVLDATQYIDGCLLISATVSKTGYDNATISSTAISSSEANFSVQLSKTVTMPDIENVTITTLDADYTGQEQELITSVDTDTEGATIEYSTDNSTWSEQIPKETDVAEYSVYVRITKDGYNTYESGEKIAKINAIDIPDIDITAKQFNYVENTSQELVTLTGNFEDTDTVTWSVNNTATGDRSIPTGLAAGSYTVKLEINRGSNYKPFTKEVTSTILNAELNLDGLSVTGLDGTYTGNPQDAVTVSNQGSYDLKYQLDDGDLAVDNNAWSNDIPTVTNAGSYIVWVKAVKANYNDKDVEVTPADNAVAPYNVYIAKAEQTFAFTDSKYNNEESSVEIGSADLTNGKTFNFGATDTAALAGGTISYSLELGAEDGDIATINSTTGELTVTGAGKITVKATLTGNDNYNDCTIQHILNVTAKKSSEGEYVSFPTDSIEYVLGNSSGITANAAIKTFSKDKGAISYSIEDNTDLGLSVSNSGVVTVSDYSKVINAIENANNNLMVTITASKAEVRGWRNNVKWPADSVSYTLRISLRTAPDSAYTVYDVADLNTALTGPDGTNDWFNTAVEIMPASGYSIVRSDNISTGVPTFSASVKYGEMQDAEAQDQGIGDRIIYLKHIETGEITEKIVTSVNKLDNEKPYNVGIEFPEATEKDDVKYYGDEITVTFTAYDNTSGVSKFNWEYTRADGSSTSILEADSGTVEAIRDSHDSTKYVGTLTLPRNQAEQLRGNLKVSATDVADNTCDSYTDTGVFVVDTIAPTQTVSYQLKDGVGTTQTVDTKHYFSNDVVLTFDIVEANFFASDVKIFVSKNGGANQLQTLSWETTENIDENEAKLTLSEDGDYVISMSYEDRSGKVMTSYISDTVVVDKTIPVLEFDYKDYTDTENPQSAIVTITEHNFRASDIEFDVITKNIAGQSVIGNDLQQYLRNLDWTSNGDVHTATISGEFVDAIYDLTFNYKDLALNAAAEIKPEQFIVDRTAPDIAKMSVAYSNPLVDTILSAITFGYYKPTVNVTFTGYDNKDANAIGIIGRKERQNEFIKCLLIDIISRQYFGDVNVYAFIDDNVQEYDWLKLIPHIQPNPNFRNIVCDTESKNIVFEYLYKELTYRSEHKGVPGHNVIFILNDNGIKSHPISRFIEHASELNTTFIFFETEKKYLPLYCSQIVVLEENYSAYTYASENKTDKTEFKYACVSSDKVQRAIDILAPVYCEEISLESSLRKNISLFELLGIYSANDLELKTRWNDSKIYETMAVPLGINVKNDVVCLNLHEKFHGPHGLVAGTTGSGKSEILQSFILSAATYFHPYEIGFVIIDFKGGGMVNQFKDLPHLIGAITNIDGNEIQRSLKSIKAELMKRQNHFASAGVNHIDKYIQLYKDGKVTEALPHLIIIVDEFAELKAEQPEFMKELISAARIGRSLGVHLILATQKPSGVVDAQIWSNSKFKLCLKVQSKEDSNEVIKTPLAAEIKEPGRAYLQVGNNEIFELFQSAYSGAPATVDASEVEKEFVISKVGFTGNRKPIYVRKKRKQKINVQNQLDAIVAYIHDYCNKEGIKKLADICMPPLPETLYFDAGKRVDSDEVFVTFGLVDDPDHQSQMTHKLNITAMNYMLIGSTQTGKTNFLQTAIRSLTEHYSPDEVNIYIVDFASMILKNFENLNHVGGVVLSHEDEKVKNLFRLLSNEIDLRKSRFAEVGVSSFASYKEAGYRDLPQIVVVIDNLTALKELYLQDNDMLLPVCRDGNSVGISFLVANGQTAGVGYRYLNNFEGRIALFCNESSEYTMLFEGNRTKLPNVPGRALVQIDKATYECQMYLAFDGDKEYERVQNIQKYVTSCNERYVGMNARVIPEIPKCLDIGYVEKHYAQANTNDELMIGLDYETIEPLSMNLNENDMIVLSGKKDVSRKAFAKYIISVFADKKFGKTELYVLDTLAGKWGELEILPQTAYYTTDADSSISIVTEIGQIVEQRYQNYINRRSNLQDESWIVVIVDNNDAILALSSNKNAMATLKDIWGKYSGMKVIFVFTDINNASIPFNAPEIMKIIKERKKYIIFDEISNIKTTDIPLSLTRKYSKPLETGDAYLVEDGDVKKIRTIN